MFVIFRMNFTSYAGKITMDKDKERRKKENERILNLMKSGDSLSTIPTSATWFPPRPTIKKDLSKFYKKKADDDDDD